MISRRIGRFALGVTGVACLALGVTLAGCMAEDETPQARVVAPPPPPPAPLTPKVTLIADLMAELQIDERVELPEAKAPDNDPDREAVLGIFDAFARGDAETLGSMISPDDNLELEDLVSSGTWRETVADITRIEIQTGIAYDQKCALGIFHVGGEFQPQLWYYHYSSAADGFVFEAAPTPPDIMDKLSGADWIAAWHQILVDELARGDDPDEVVEVAQRNYDDEGAGGGRSGGGSAGRTPQAPPGGPKRRTPKTPRPPPGPG